MAWQSWWSRAACKDLDPDLFHPIGPSAAQGIEAARRICRACPVSRQCLNLAIELGEPAGIWGGRTPEERRLIRARIAS